MSNLITVNGEPMVSTEVLAAGVDQQHASVLKLVRRHLASFNEVGRVRFEIRSLKTNGGTQLREFAVLNEHQATLLISFMRNSPKVLRFKIGLVKEFYSMRDKLAIRDGELWKQMQKLIAKEVSSELRATFGARLLNNRKRDIPRFRRERLELEQKIQPTLC